MAIFPSLNKVDPDDPRRCKGQFQLGQCQFESVEGSQYCRIHTGDSDALNVANNNIRSYQIARWQTQLNRFYENPNIKTLREEIAIARMALEAIINKCEKDYDIILYSNKIQTMLMQIEKLVVSCNRLEDRLGMTLDKSAAINLASELITIVNDYIPDADRETVANKVASAINNAGRAQLK